jgi:hypothetical protein
VYGGPLQGDAFAFGVLNRDDPAHVPSSNLTVSWGMLELPGMGPTTSACVRELYSGTNYGVQVGGVTVPVPGRDIAVLRVVPGASQC